MVPEAEEPLVRIREWLANLPVLTGYPLVSAPYRAVWGGSPECVDSRSNASQ